MPNAHCDEVIQITGAPSRDFWRQIGASFAGPEPVPADRKPTVLSDEHHGAVQGLLTLEPDYVGSPEGGRLSI